MNPKDEENHAQIILVRPDGQTPWNQEKIFGGPGHSLDDNGREEARLAGEWSRGRPSTPLIVPLFPGPGTPARPSPGTMA